MTGLAEELGRLLREKGLTLGTVESATGGLISQIITSISGSSDYYRGSIISYSNEIKIRLAGVNPDSIGKHGAVSAQVAEEMAAGGRKALEVDVCVADTGIAGPDGESPEKPVGLFYLGLSFGDNTESRRHVFGRDRTANRQQAAKAALEWVCERLEKG